MTNALKGRPSKLRGTGRCLAWLKAQHLQRTVKSDATTSIEQRRNCSECLEHSAIELQGNINMTAPIVRDFIRKALLELKEHELREVIESLAPLIHCEVIPKRSEPTKVYPGMHGDEG